MHLSLEVEAVAAQTAVVAVAAVQFNPSLVTKWHLEKISQSPSASVVRQAYGWARTPAMQVELVHCSREQNQLRRQMAAVVVLEARVVQAAVLEVYRQRDSLVARVVFHPPLVARSAASAKTEPPIISLELWTITAEVELAVLMAVQRPHQLHPATARGLQAA